MKTESQAVSRKTRVMNVIYTISEIDYVRAMKLYYKITPKIATIYAVLGLTLVLAMFFGPEIVSAGAIGAMIGGLIVIVLGRLIFSPFIAKRHYGKYKSIQEPITLELKEDGVGFSTADGRGVLPWEKILKWRQNDSYLLLYPMPRLYHIIPKTVVQSGFDLPSLIAKLEERIGPES
jgi:hypothetical protein